MISDTEKPFPAFDKLRHVLPEQRERRIGDNDIGLLEQVDTLLASEVAVVTEFARGDLRWVWKTVPLLFAAVLEENALKILLTVS